MLATVIPFHNVESSDPIVDGLNFASSIVVELQVYLVLCYGEVRLFAPLFFLGGHDNTS